MNMEELLLRGSEVRELRTERDAAVARAERLEKAIEQVCANLIVNPVPSRATVLANLKILEAAMERKA